MNNGDSLQRLNDATKVTAEPRTNNSDDAHSVYAASRPPLPPASTSLLNQSRSPGEGDEQQMDSSLDDDTKDVVGGDNVTQEMEGNESQETSPDTKPSPKSQEPTKVKKKPGRPKGSKNTPAKILKFSRQNISNSFPSQFENKTIEYDATGIVSAGDLSTSEGRVNILDEAFEAMKRIQKRSRELGWEHWAEGGGEEGGKEEEEEVGKAVVMQGGGEVGGGKSVGRGIAPEVQPPAKKRRLKSGYNIFFTKYVVPNTPLYRDQNGNLLQHKSKIVGAAWKALLPEDVMKWKKEAFKINVGLGLLDQDDLQDFLDGKNFSIAQTGAV